VCSAGSLSSRSSRHLPHPHPRPRPPSPLWSANAAGRTLRAFPRANGPLKPEQNAVSVRFDFGKGRDRVNFTTPAAFNGVLASSSCEWNGGLKLINGRTRESLNETLLRDLRPTCTAVLYRSYTFGGPGNARYVNTNSSSCFVRVHVNRRVSMLSLHAERNSQPIGGVLV